MFVEFSYDTCHFGFSCVGVFKVGLGIYEYCSVQFSAYGTPHTGIVDVKKAVFFFEEGDFNSAAFRPHIKRTALKEVEHKIAVFCAVHCVFNVHRIAVYLLQFAEQGLHQLCKCLLFQQLLAADKPYVSWSAAVIQSLFRFIIMLKEQSFQPFGDIRQHLFQILFRQCIFLQIQHVYLMLGKAVFFRCIPRHGYCGAIQVHEAGVIIFRPIHSLCAQPHYQPEHAFIRADILLQLIGAVAVSHSRGAGHI